MSGPDRPAMAKVLLLNDEGTTMEFVVQVSRGNIGVYVKIFQKPLAHSNFLNFCNAFFLQMLQASYSNMGLRW